MVVESLSVQTPTNKMPDRTFRNSLFAATVTAVGATGVVTAGWCVFEFDRALFFYAQTLILSLTLTVYRLSIWFHRPPTRVTYQRAWTVLTTSQNRLALAGHLVSRAAGYFVLNRFVWKRGPDRWAAHWPIMIGCLMALAIVMPLIFGWVWFETPSDDLRSYKVMNFGVHMTTIPMDIPCIIPGGIISIRCSYDRHSHCWV